MSMCFRGGVQGHTKQTLKEGLYRTRSEQGCACCGLCSVDFRERGKFFGINENCSGSGSGQAPHGAALY